MICRCSITSLPRELAPLEDRGRIWVRASAPEGVSYEYMQRFMDDVAGATAEQVPEARFTMTQVPGPAAPVCAGAVNNGFVRLFLTDKSERARVPAGHRRRDLRGLAREFTVARINITQEASMGERRAQSSGVRVRAPGARRSTCCARRCRRFSRRRKTAPCSRSSTAISSSAAPRCR